MKKIILPLGLLFAFGLGLLTMSFVPSKNEEKHVEKPIKLGVFSLSLSVKDLKVSKAFYEYLGFSKMGGDMASNYLIMKN